MLELLSPMASVLASWFLLFWLFSGIGALALNSLGQPIESGWIWHDGFWIGWILILGLVQIWHFASPVNDMLMLILAASSALCLFTMRARVASMVRSLPNDKLFILLSTLLALWLSNRALGMPVAYDTGFRDLQAVMWIDSYPLVPGLGNLFSSLAFNQSAYLYDALLDAFVWSGRSNYIATGLLVFAYLLRASKAALCLYRCTSIAELRWSWVFVTLTAPYVLSYTVTLGGITHFLTDTAVDLVGFICIIYVVDLLQFWRTDSEEKDYLFHRFALVIIAGFTIKLSFTIFGAAMAIFAGAVWLARCHDRLSHERLARMLLPLVAATCLMLLPWLARGAITSGYLVYPHTIGRIGADWTLPQDQLQQRQLNLSANTRLRGGDRETVLASWDWLGPWLGRFAGNIMATMMPTLITLAAFGLHAVRSKRCRNAKQNPRMTSWVLVPLVMTLLLWFLSFPEPKYVRYVLWSLAALAVIVALQSGMALSMYRWKFTTFAVTALGIGYVIYLIVQLGTFPLPAGPERGFYPLPAVSHDKFETEAGLTLNVPVGDVPQCWRIPLPCTPYPNPKLETRVPGDLRHGFRISDG